MVPIHTCKGSLTGVIYMGKHKGWRAERRSAFLEPRPYQYFIYSEGLETERNYFNGFKDAIEENPVYRDLVTVQVVGVGRGTDYVVNKARKDAKESHLRDARIWCVFDKDDFPDQKFDSAISAAEYTDKQTNIDYHAGWSNECFELWILLHFSFHRSDNGRAEYIRFLNEQFKSHGLPGYSKTDKELFTELLSIGSPKHAIRYSKKLAAEQDHLPPSKQRPATSIYKLVEELAKFLPEDLHSKFIDQE